MRNTQKQATRDRILQIARNLLESEGYEAATIRRIAQEAGVATGTVFVHFANKEDLFYSSFYDELAQLMEQAFDELPSGSLQRQLSYLVNCYFSAFAGRPALYSRLLKESIFASGDWGQRFKSQVEGFGQRVAGLYLAARTRSEIAAETDILTAVASFLAFYYLTLISLAANNFEDLEQPQRIFERMLQQHLQGLQPNPPQGASL